MIGTNRKVLLIGWDGADWEHINPLMDEGLLPNLERLVNGGTIANLATLQPVLSPMLWNSVATGKFADKHGIHGFIEPDEESGGARPFSSISRKTKALWNIFSQNGLRSNVINWWASHPAEKINGCVVSNLFNGVRIDPEKGWQITPGTIHPAECEQEYAPFKFFPNEMEQAHILPFIPGAAQINQEEDSRLSSFAKTFGEMMTTHSVGTAVMELHPWDFMAIYFTGIDHFSHGFMQYHPPKLDNVSDEDFEMYKDVVKGAYRFHDLMLARLLELADDDTTVILCSDHGFQSGAFRPFGTPREPAGPAVWHRQYGILVMKGPGIKQDERIYGASLIDVGPTILHLYGLPVGEDMDGRVLIEAFENPGEIKTIPSWNEVEGDHGMHDQDISMSSAQSNELMKQFVALGYMDDFGDDKEKQNRSAKTESRYNLAKNLMWQNRHEEALKLLQELLNESPWEDRFIIQLADCYNRAGYHQQAINLIQQAYDFENTQHNQAIIVCARAHLNLGQEETGLKLLGVATRRSPKFPLLHAQIGDVLAKLRRWDDARKSYLNALNLHGELAQAHQGLAHVYIRQGKNQEAIDSALDAVGLIHRLPKAHIYLGVGLVRSNNLEKSVVAFRNAAKFAPQSKQAHRWLSHVYEQLGNKVLADEHRRIVADLNNFLDEERVEQADRAQVLFEFPVLEDEADRHKRLIAERPSPNDKVEKSGKTFVLVSGLPRSGTSLMMQMLNAGGMESITDGKREADEDNPKGYFEWEDIKQIAGNPDLLDPAEYEGKFLKTISMLLSKMPAKHDYKVIFMMRPIMEIASSQKKMLERLGTEGAAVEQKRLIRELASHRAESLNFLKTSKNFEHLTVDYPKLIENPDEIIEQVIEFLGDSYITNPDNMRSSIDKSLYRNRTS